MEEKFYYLEDGTRVTAQEVIDDLIQQKMLFTADDPKKLNYYITKIADRMKCTPKKALRWLNTVSNVSSGAALNIVLKQIAIEFDKKYENHIKDSDKIFVISLLNGKVTEVNKEHIKNYRNFAAFRTFSDAIEAKKICANLFKKMFCE